MTHGREQVIYTDFWHNHLVEIEDNGDHRSLYFGDRSLQSRMSLADPHELVLSYTRYMAFPLLINLAPRTILIVGIGAGSLLRFCHHYFPDSRIDAVDYSPQIIRVASRYFHLPESTGIAVHCADGCDFLQDSPAGRYDLVLIDAFDDQGMAPTVYSDRFFRLCAGALTPDGVVSGNLWSNDRVKLQQIKAVLSSHFAGCLYLPVAGRGNIIAVAMPYAVPWSRICLKKKAIAALSKQYGLDFSQLILAAKRNMTLSTRLASWLP